jgi:hypothetical protein
MRRRLRAPDRLPRLADLPPRRRRQIRLLRTVALLLAAGAVTVWLRTPSGDVDTAVEPLPPAPAVLPPAANGPDAESEPAPEVAPPRLAPLRVRVPAIDVDAPVVPVGILPGDVMEIPDDVDDLGWYDPDGLGVAPGLAGTAVLAGHVDSRTQGRGALYDLRELAVGDLVEIALEDGSVQAWRVTDVIQYPKATLPYDEVFTWSGSPRLALITCGGEFDRTERSYLDNIVAYAEPVASSS